MYSFVIKMAIDVNRAVIFVTTIPTLGFIKDIVDEVIAQLDSFELMVIDIITSFFLNLHIPFHNNNYQSWVNLECSYDSVFFVLYCNSLNSSSFTVIFNRAGSSFLKLDKKILNKKNTLLLIVRLFLFVTLSISVFFYKIFYYINFVICDIRLFY